MRRVLLAATWLLIAVLQGCATITGSEMQPVSLTTQTNDGQILEGVRCSLRNDKGAWNSVSPGFVNVNRSAEDLVIECRKQGLPDGFARAISRAHGGMFGNIIFGGGIGAIIDHSKGTGYEYPNTVPIRMGRSIVVDRADQGQIKEEPVASGQPRSAPLTSAPAPQPVQVTTSINTPPAPGPTASSMSEIADARLPGIERPAQQALPEPVAKAPRISTMSFEVEKLARGQGCKSPKGPELLTEPGPLETFRVRCEAGGELTIRCELRNCRILN